jgi:hypothetical protein
MKKPHDISIVQKNSFDENKTWSIDSTVWKDLVKRKKPNNSDGISENKSLE